MTFIKLLYGSRARGEADELSDTDMLWVADEDGADYTWSDIERLREYGSLFLWHLHLEAQLLCGDESGRAAWSATTQALPQYSRARQDVRAFEVVLSDVQYSLDTRDAPIAYERAVVARTLRHAAILACFLNDVPDFSRYGGVARASQIYNLPLPSPTFEVLYDCVLRRTPHIDEASLRAWVAWGRSLNSAMNTTLTPRMPDA